MNDKVKVGQAAKHLGVTPETVRNLIRRGEIKAELTDGGQRLIPREELERLPVRTRAVPATDDGARLEELQEEEKHHPVEKRQRRRASDERLEILRGLGWSLAGLFSAQVRLNVRRGLDAFITLEEFPSYVDPADACDSILQRVRLLDGGFQNRLDQTVRLADKLTSGAPVTKDEDRLAADLGVPCEVQGFFQVVSKRCIFRSRILARAGLAYARLIMLGWSDRLRAQGENRVRGWLQSELVGTETTDQLYAMVSKVLDGSLRGSPPVRQVRPRVDLDEEAEDTLQ